MPVYRAAALGAALGLCSVVAASAAPGSRSSAGISCAAYSPDGRMAAGGSYRAVLIYDSSTGKVIRRLEGPSAGVNAVQFSPDGRLLAAAGGLPARSGEIRLWDARTWRALPALYGHRDAIYALAFSPDSHRIAAGSYDHLISVWELGGRNASPQILKDHTDSVYAVAFSPDGKLLASAAGDRTVKVWDAATGRRLYSLSESTAELYAVAFRPAASGAFVLAAGGVDRTLRTYVIGLREGRLLKAAFVHDAPILRIAYTPDGASILTSGEDRAVKRFDSTTLVEQAALPRQLDWPQGLAIRPDGRQLAVGRHAAGLRFYPLIHPASPRQAYRNPPPQHKSSIRQVKTVVRNSARKRRNPASPVPALSLNTQAGAAPARSGASVWRFGLPCAGDASSRRPRKTGGPTLSFASLGAISPVGVERGRETRLTLSGGRIADATAVHFDDPGITGRIATPPDSNPGILRVDARVAATVRPGVHRAWVETPFGSTGSATFAVGAWPEVAEAEPNDSFERAQHVKLPCTLTGAISQPGDSDLFRFDARAGDELVFEIVAQPIRSRLQAVLAVVDASGHTLAETRARIGEADPVQGYRFTNAGAYAIRVRDYEQAGGGDFHYRLNAGAFPLVTEVRPAGVRAGESAAVRVKGFNLGAVSTVNVQAPAAAAWGATVELPLLTSAGPPIRPVRLAVGADPEVESQPGAVAPASAQVVRLPCTISGVLDSSARCYRFAATKGQRLVLEVMARRLRSPMDSEIEVLDVAGRPVERAVLRAVGRTEMVLNDRDSTTPALRLQNWDDFHINDYLLVGREVVRILALPKGPDDDVQFRQLRGQRRGYFGTTPEFHSLGTPVFKVEPNPPGTQFSPNGYPLTPISYRNDDGGGVYGKDSYLEFTAPASGEYIVRLRDARGDSGPDFAYRLMIHEPRPDFRIAMSPERPNIPAGGSTGIDVTCDRLEGMDAPIEVALEGLPAGFAATTTTIEAGESSATLLVTAPAAPVRAAGSPRLTARARIGDHEVVHAIEPENGVRAFTATPQTDIRVTTDVPNEQDVPNAPNARGAPNAPPVPNVREVVIRPGQEVEIEARVERLGEFGKRVPITVSNLPFGVRVMDVGLNGVLVTEEQDSRKFRLYCEPWVRPQRRAIYVFGEVEGGIRTAAPPLTLRVLPASGTQTGAIRQ